MKVFPRDDVEFVAYAHATLAALAEGAGPAELERRLRESYGSARVREQEHLGMNGAPRPHWYVFRDGRVIAARPAERADE